MSEHTVPPVLVAVGHDPIDAALEYAARTAVREGCGLHLLHVLHRVSQGAETVLVDIVDLEHTARSTLAAAEERAHDLVPDDVPVTTQLVWGGPVHSIVAASKDSRMVVLQRRPLSRVVRVVTRSTSSGVAAHAHVPVVSVPASWTSTSGEGGPIVTVGVDVPERAENVLRAAVHEARGRGATLRVLHTWAFPGAYDDIIVSRVEHDQWTERATKDIHEALAKLGDEASGLTVEVEARHAHPGDALIKAARRSDLLVVGRHDPLVPAGSHLGPVARAVLREATCPVLLADPRPRHHWGSHRQRADVV
jgi:nucleotide-binding universal stress UspA family protein